MKKLAAISTAVSIYAAIQGISLPASANQIQWRTLGYDSNGTTPYFYDQNFVSRSGDVVLTRVSGLGKVFFLGLSCSRNIMSASPDGKHFEPPQRIVPHSAGAKLYGMFCHSDYNQQISDYNRQMNVIKSYGNLILNVSEPVK